MRSGATPISGGFGVAALAALVACGAGSEPATYTVTSVVVTPGAAKVQPGAILAFSARVLGTGTGSHPPVRWSVEVVSGSATDPGIVDSGGLYRAPAVAPSTTLALRVVATCSGVVGTADVAVPSASIVLRGGATSVSVGDVVQFEVQVDGTLDPRVDWQAFYGTVDATGRYTAPLLLLKEGEVDTVRVRSLGNGLTAEQSISIHARTPTLSSISNPAGPGDTLTIHGAGFSQVSGISHPLVLFPSGAGGPIRTSGTALGDDTMTVTVPFGAASGDLRVGVPPSWAPSAPIHFERAPRLRLHVLRSDVASGEAVPVEVAVLGVPGPVPITFSADAGTFAGGQFVAPTVADRKWTVVRACVTGTTICSSATIAVHPFRVEPAPAVARLGAALTLSALGASGPIPATFSLDSGPWSVTADGAFTSFPAIADAGEAWVTAYDGAHAELVPVIVAGGVPGELATATPEYGGIATYAVAVDGTRAWALASDSRGDTFWIDAYDVADPLCPRWLGATESATSIASLHFVQGHLYALSERWSDRVVASYDVSGPPVLVGRVERPVTVHLDGTRILAPLVLDAEGGAVADPEAPPLGATSLTAHLYALSDPSLSTVRDVTLTFPAEADLGSWIIALSVQGGRAYASYPAVDRSWRLGAWDLSTDIAGWLGSTSGLDSSGPMSFPGPLLMLSGCLFDRRTPVPAFLSCVLEGDYIAVPGEGARQLLTDGFQSVVLDVADPGAPRLDAVFPGSAGAMAGGLAYEPRMGGIALHDVTPGGPLLRAPDIWIGDFTSSLNAVALSGDLLYVTGFNAVLGGFLSTVDLAAAPPAVEGITALPSPGMAILVDGDRLLVGFSTALEIRLAADPHAPAIASLPLDVFSLATDGDVAWVGTWSGDLVAVDLVHAGGPVEVGRLAIGAFPRRIRVLGPGLLALALQSLDYASGDLAIVDGSISSIPLLLASGGLGMPVIDLALEGPTAALATPAGLVTVDLATPSTPTVLAMVAIPEDVPQDPANPPWYAAAEVHDGIAWLGTYLCNGAVLGYDLRDPARPREVARWLGDGPLIGGTIVQLAFDGPRMAVSRIRSIGGLDVSTLAVLDVAQPRNVLRSWGAAPGP